MNVPELRPLGIGEILDVSIKLYLRNAWVLFKAVALVVIPFSVFVLLLELSTTSDAALVDGELLFPTEQDLQTYRGASIFAAIIGVAVTLIATGAAFKAVAEAYLGREPTAGESLRFAGRRLGSLLWIAFLFMVVLAALFIPAGIIVAVSRPLGILIGLALAAYVFVGLSVTVPTFLTEHVRGLNAMNRSRALVKGRWWQTFAVVLVGVILIPLIVAFILGFLAGILTFLAPGSVVGFLVVQWIANAIANIVTTPLQAAVLMVLYFDLRVRREGFDLQLLAQRIGITGGPTFGGPQAPPINLPPPPPPPSGPPGSFPPSPD